MPEPSCFCRPVPATDAATTATAAKPPLLPPLTRRLSLPPPQPAASRSLKTVRRSYSACAPSCTKRCLFPARPRKARDTHMAVLLHHCPSLIARRVIRERRAALARGVSSLMGSWFIGHTHRELIVILSLISFVHWPLAVYFETTRNILYTSSTSSRHTHALARLGLHHRPPQFARCSPRRIRPRRRPIAARRPRRHCVRVEAFCKEPAHRTVEVVVRPVRRLDD